MSYKHAVLQISRKAIILKANTGATRNYIRGQDIIIQLPVLESDSPTTQLFNQHSLDTYLSQCYHQQPHKPTHIQTSKSPASFQLDNYVIQIAPHLKKRMPLFSTQTRLLYSMEQVTHPMVYGMSHLELHSLKQLPLQPSINTKIPSSAYTRQNHD